MADFQRYQPRRSRAGGPAWRPFVIGVGAIILVVIVWRAMASGLNNRTDSDNENSGISLLTNNGNTAVTSAENSNTNSAPTDVPAADAVNVEDCTAAIGSRGEAKRVALTFNLTSANEAATAVIAALVKAKAPGSFFVTGSFAEKNADYLKQFTTKGFGVYNRSYDNARFTTLSAEAIASQLEKTEIAIAAATGKTSKPFFRAPYGDVNEAVVTAAREAGYCTILWSVDAYDWSSDATVSASTARVMKALKPGAIVMMSAGYDITAELVAKLASDIRKAGYELTSLPNLLTS